MGDSSKSVAHKNGDELMYESCGSQGLATSMEQGTIINNRDSLGSGGVAAAVAAFHVAFKLPHQAQPNINIDESLAKLRISLLEEEFNEYVASATVGDLIGIADALADIAYVAYGTALTYGIDLDLVLSEVHRANMSKLGSNGRPLKREDGKVAKI
jgi:predicted HAD superfamily Cof-like phosphohydrolase